MHAFSVYILKSSRNLSVFKYVMYHIVSYLNNDCISQQISIQYRSKFFDNWHHKGKSDATIPVAIIHVFVDYVAYTVLVTEMYLFRGSNPCPILGLKGVYLHSQFLSNLLLKDCVFHHHFFKLYRGSASQIVFGCSLAIVYKYEIYLYLDSSYLSSK